MGLKQMVLAVMVVNHIRLCESSFEKLNTSLGEDQNVLFGSGKFFDTQIVSMYLCICGIFMMSLQMHFSFAVRER